MSTAQTGRTHDLHPTASRKPKEPLDPWAPSTHVAQLHAVQTQVNGLDKRIAQAHRANADSKRLDAIPGFGVILSTAVVATAIGD